MNAATDFTQDQLIDRAANGELSYEFAAMIVNGLDAAPKIALANRRNLPTGIVNLLAADLCSEVRKLVAARDDINFDIVADLANDTDYEVTIVIAERPYLHVQIIKMLSDSKSWHVRRAIERRWQN